MVLNFLKLASLRGLVIALFLMPSFVSASYLFDTTQSTNPSVYEPTVQAACQEWFDAYTRNSQHLEVQQGVVTTHYGQNRYSTTYICKSILDSVYYVQSSQTVWAISADCPTGFEDDGSGECVEQTECPVGTVDIGSGGVQECVDICTAGDVRTIRVPLGDIPSSILDNIGCSATYNGVVGNCTLLADDTATCYAEFATTGDHNEVHDCNDWHPTGFYEDCYTVFGEGGDSTQNVTPQSEPTTSQNNISDATASTQVDPSVVDTLPDGTVITTDIQTDSSSASDTIKISETTPGFIFIEEKDGSTTIIQTQTTTTSNPDGSSSVQTEQTNTYTSPKIEITSLDKSTGSSSKTSTGGQTSGGSSTTINNYNSSGSLTSSTQEQTGDGSGTDEPCPVNTICAEDGTEYALPTGEGSFDDAMSQVGSEIAQAKADLLSTFNGIKSQASQLVSFNAGSGSGALPCPPPIDIAPFGTFDLCFQSYETELSIVGTIIIFIAYFLALAIILR